MTDAYVVADNLGKSFKDKVVLEGLSFEIEPGDVIGVLGLNGAGKTTLLELMLGFTPPSGGSVKLFGHESFNVPGSVKARVGFVPQQDELINQLTVADQIGVIASFYPSWDDQLIQRLCRDWGVEMDSRIKAMSVGQRQKLSILLSLGHRPDLLILDEPVASLDPVARRQFLEQIVEVSADGDRSVVFSSHIVSDIERLANKIWILKDHKLHWRGDFDSLRESIVRVHIHGSTPLPESFAFPNMISVRREATYASAIISEWHEECAGELAAQIGARVEVESLTLEDIFLELHR